MKLQVGCALFLFSAVAGFSCGQSAALVNPVPPAGGANAAAGQQDKGQALDMLEKRGESLDAFIANVKLSEENEIDGVEKTTRVGKVWYQKLPDGTVRLRVSFTDRQEAGNQRPEQKDYVLDKGWLTERDGEKKIEIRRQVLRPGEKMNPTKLGQGPFPLPIGQKKEDVEKQFEVTKKELKKGEPAGTTHLQLKPRDDSPLKKDFSVIDIFLDPKQEMPVRIETLDNKGKMNRTTELDKIQVNPKLTDQDFALPKIEGSKWTVREEPLEK
jgi:hypothetical protein